jgi:hypothetical protein
MPEPLDHPGADPEHGARRARWSGSAGVPVPTTGTCPRTPRVAGLRAPRAPGTAKSAAGSCLGSRQGTACPPGFALRAGDVFAGEACSGARFSLRGHTRRSQPGLSLPGRTWSVANQDHARAGSPRPGWRQTDVGMRLALLPGGRPGAGNGRRGVPAHQSTRGDTAAPGVPAPGPAASAHPGAGTDRADGTRAAPTPRRGQRLSTSRRSCYGCNPA